MRVLCIIYMSIDVSGDVGSLSIGVSKFVKNILKELSFFLSFII